MLLYFIYLLLIELYPKNLYLIKNNQTIKQMPFKNVIMEYYCQAIITSLKTILYNTRDYSIPLDQ